jgi:hypothetical protein
LIIIAFEDEGLHGTCVNLERAEQAYGSVSAAALVTFLSDAESLESVEELMGVMGEEIIILPDDSLSVAIGSDYRAALVVVGTRHALDASGRIVWSSVARLKLLAISRVP